MINALNITTYRAGDKARVVFAPPARNSSHQFIPELLMITSRTPAGAIHKSPDLRHAWINGEAQVPAGERREFDKNWRVSW
jgi:hypothetical protein